jgi:HK97 family phage major capsid protein
MDFIAILKGQLKDKERLINLTEDEADLKALQAERDDIIKQIGAEEAKAEMAEANEETKKALKEAEEIKKAYSVEKEEKVKATTQPEIKVVSPGMYKGYNLKQELGFCQMGENVGNRQLFKDYPSIRKRMNERPEMAERVLKVMIDLHERATDPGRINRARNIKAALQEGTDSEGGYIVPTEERSELLAYAREASVALRECRVINMSTLSMTIPAEDGKISVAYTDEESQATESEPTFAQVTLTAKRMDAWGVTSNELLDDAVVNGGIAGMLLDQIVEAVALKVDSTVFKGGGDPVSGMFTAKAGYSEVFGSGSTHFSEILESNVRGIVSKLNPPDYETNGRFVTHYTSLWQYINGLQDTTGRPMFHDTTNGQKDQRRLWGFPIDVSSQAPGTSAVSTAIAIFGDLTGWIIGERMTNIDLLWDPYTKMDYYQTRYAFFTRWGYAAALPNKIGRIMTAAS